MFIRLYSNPKHQQIIDIVVVDIPKSYNLFLSRDWSEKLNGYFMKDWSHLWFPYNYQPNKIKVQFERHMKYIVTYLNDNNEPIISSLYTLGNYCLDSFYGNFIVQQSLFIDSCQQSKLLHTTQVGVINCTNLVCDNVNLDVNTYLWFLYFDGSK
jgi:hypothetical protein